MTPAEMQEAVRGRCWLRASSGHQRAIVQILSAEAPTVTAWWWPDCVTLHRDPRPFGGWTLEVLPIPASPLPVVGGVVEVLEEHGPMAVAEVLAEAYLVGVAVSLRYEGGSRPGQWRSCRPTRLAGLAVQVSEGGGSRCYHLDKISGVRAALATAQRGAA